MLAAVVVLLAAAGCSGSEPAPGSDRAAGPEQMLGSEQMPGSGAAGGTTSASSVGASVSPVGSTGVGGDVTEGTPDIAAGLTGGAAGAPDASSAGAPSVVDAEPAIRFVGRFDRTDPAGPRFAWSGSGMIARFSGTSVGVRLTGNQQYTVLVDGTLQPKLISTNNLDPLASDLPPGEHVVEVYRRTEASQGEAQLLGFDFGQGELLAPPPAPERRIEIIGDSISCGYGVEGPDETCSFTPDTENHYITYGALAARELGADLVTVAWSGKGAVCNYGDEPTSCDEPMPTFIDRTLPERADSVWDFAAYQPQAVVINLGTNDFSTNADPSAEDFEAGYVSLLERVRSAYPDATILCSVGPLLHGTDLAAARGSIESAVASRTAAGDTAVQTFELAEIEPAVDGYGCDYHPSPATHEIMADALTSALRAALGW